jgi:ATP diphosphatase
MVAAGDSKRTLDDLVAVMAALRAPVTGCPWDLEQDFASIAPYTIEEAYEVADAIARTDMGDLQEELGDLLLQVSTTPGSPRRRRRSPSPT